MHILIICYKSLCAIGEDLIIFRTKLKSNDEHIQGCYFAKQDPTY